MIRRSKLGPVPEDTAAAARACFKRKRNFYIEFADTFSELFDFGDFSEAYSNLGQSAVHPVRVLLLIMAAHLEGLSDRQAAEALASRIDLKYLLALPLTHPGFDSTVLCEMRTRLIENGLDSLLFERILQFAEERGLLKAGKQRTDSTTILAAARRLTRLELLIETLTHGLDVLSAVCPKLILAAAATFEQTRVYEVSGFQSRLPKKETEQKQLAEAVGRDGLRLLRAIDNSSQAGFLNQIECVKTLRLVWSQQFDIDEKGGPNLRSQDKLPPASEQVVSPHDVDARITAKRDDPKLGYNIHVTETCTEDAPRLITNVLTTPATTSDSKSLTTIERELGSRGRRPQQHFVDAGYTKSDYMLRVLEQHGTEIVGPLRGGNNWQSQTEGGKDISQFSIDWETETAICPNGKQNIAWRKTKRGSVDIRFSMYDCRVCPFQTECTRSTKVGRRLELKPQSVQAFIDSWKRYSQTEEFQKRYAIRAGIEGTMRLVKKPDAGRTRYMGLAKADLQFRILAAAINAVRILKHLCGVSLTATRTRSFGRLLAGAA